MWGLALSVLFAQAGPTGDAVQRHLAASEAYESANDPAKAVAEAEAALALAPRLEAAHLRLGQIFLAHNTPQAALEVFTEALTLLPDSILLRLGRGLALKELTRYDDARADLEAVLARKPGFSLAFDALATVLLHTKDTAALAQLASAHTRVNPADFRGPYYAAAALEGPPASIERLLAESLRLNPNFAAAHALLGKTRLQSGDPAAATGPLERALALRPDYAPAALHLAQAYQKAGRAADATRVFARLRQINEAAQTPRPSLVYRRRANP